MTFNNTQTTELSLDQLDDISAGFIGAALRGAKGAAKTVHAVSRLSAKHGLSGLRFGLKPSFCNTFASTDKRTDLWGSPYPVRLR